MRIEFSKMHGLGNDFVVLDLVTQRMNLDPELIKFLADRHFGIGFDQLLIVEPPSRPEVDFRYRIFNADGNEVEQCGNGARCFARFVIERKLSFKQHFVVETASGVIELSIDDYGWVQVDMGQPKFEPAEIPFRPELKLDDHLYSLKVNDEQVKFAVVNVGNPHAVIQVDDVLAADVETIGPIVENHAAFPERVNVGFMEVVNETHIKLRVFERGVGETQACGTGACAAVVAGVRQGLLTSGKAVRAQLYGGSLSITWSHANSPDSSSTETNNTENTTPAYPTISMVGPTETVFQGSFSLDDVMRQAGLTSR